MGEICRTCLQEIDDSVIFCLNPKDSGKSVSARCKLEYCVPELDLEIVQNAVMCSNCFESLNLAHKFKSKCLETEGRIQRYIEKIGYVFAYVDLKQIAKSDEAVKVEYPQDNLDLTNLQCDTGNFFAVPKIAQLLSNDLPLSYKCVHCNYATSTKTDLETHEKVHLLHKCNVCNFSANRRQTLIIHMRQHHIKKTFSCVACSYKTPYSATLNEHNKVHANPLKQTKARLKQDLKKRKSHTQTSSFDSPLLTDLLLCYKCEYKTARKLDLEQHMNLHSECLNLHIKSNGNDYLKLPSSDLKASKSRLV